MEFYQINNDTHENTPDSFRSFSKTDSPNIPQRGYPGNENPDSQVSQSDMSSPSHVHFRVATPENDSFKVYVRVRPLDSKEQAASNPKARLNIIKVEDQMLFVLNPYIGPEWSYKPEKSYVFNKVFDQDVKTVDLYEDGVSNAVRNVINGYNSTVLAYGMTGAGKTFTMFGDIYNAKGGPIAHPGIVSLMVSDLFRAFERETDYEFNIKFSYLEIYNEHARDVLTPSCDELMIVEDSERGIVIPNLSEYYINSHEDIFKLILLGNSRRVMASTHANQFSSRSHAIIQLIVEKRSKTKDIVDTFFQSKLCLVDLAGSERAAVSENRGLRHREGANINRSLLALGNCINILSDPHKKGAYVPYRDSKLTRLLKESLGGNTQTVFLACVSPSYLAYEETVNTLKYASRARNIQKKVVQNVKEVELHISEYKGIIESLRGEVNFLKQKLHQKDDTNIGSTQPKLAAEYATKVNTALDELGMKLVSIFEENWEYNQSLNELKALKTQNDEILKAKVYELGRTVGNVRLYNLITDEITALKEVMANNETIQKETEANIERSNQEKSLVQSQILKLISQNAQSSDNVKKEISLEELTRNAALMGMESPTFRKMPVSEERGSKMEELLDEMQQMRRQLAEKDKQLVKNQELLQSFLQTNSRSDSLQPTSARLVPQTSPIAEHTRIDNGRESSKWADLSHQEEDLRAAELINRIPTTAQMPTISKINTLPTMAPQKDTDMLPASLFSQSSSTISLSKALDSRRVPINEQQDFQTQDLTSLHGPSYAKMKEPFYQGNYGNKLLGNPGDLHVTQTSGVGSLDDLNNHGNPLNCSSLDNIHEETIENNRFQYQTAPNKLTEMYSSVPQVASYRLSEQPLVKSSTATKHPKGLSTSSSHTEGGNVYKMPISPRSQVHQQQNLLQPSVGDDYSPNLSSIVVQTHEQSGDGSFKDLLSENLTTLGKITKGSGRTLGNGQFGKENLQKSEVSPKTPVTRNYSRLSSHKSPSNARSINTTKSPDVSAQLRNQKLTKSMHSPISGSIKAKGLLPSSPDRQVVLRSQENRLMTSSLHVDPRQQGDKFSYGIQDEIKSAKKSFVEPAKEKYETKTTSNKAKNDTSRNQNKSPFLQSNKNVQSGEYREKKSAYTILPNEPRAELKSLDTRRDRVKVFRTKLHQLASAVDNNRVGEIYIREIQALLEEYRLNAQTYPLTTGDVHALRKLEDIVSRRAYESEGGFSDMIKTKDTAEPLSGSQNLDEGERPFGTIEPAAEIERKEETKKNIQPIEKQASITQPKAQTKTRELKTTEIIPLYLTFGLIVAALLFNLFSRLGGQK